jgi:hypothetical protein
MFAIDVFGKSAPDRPVWTTGLALEGCANLKSDKTFHAASVASRNDIMHIGAAHSSGVSAHLYRAHTWRNLIPSDLHIELNNSRKLSHSE